MVEDPKPGDRPRKRRKDRTRAKGSGVKRSGARPDGDRAARAEGAGRTEEPPRGAGAVEGAVEPTAAGDGKRRGWPASSTVWALITGLAVGFLAGREVTRFGQGDTAASPDGAPVSKEAVAGAKGYGSLDEFPADWIKDTDLKVLAGLDDAQKRTVLQALNERNCECGCSFGSVANCLKNDPGCPRSPELGKLAADLVRQGKGLTEILAALDAHQSQLAGKKAPPPASPTGPVYLELAAWNPRKGPEHAKVTIVEFSDFQ